MKLYVALINKYLQIEILSHECDVVEDKFVPTEEICGGISFPVEHENVLSTSRLIDRCLIYTTDSSKFKTLAMELLNGYKKLVGVETGEVITKSENTINDFEIQQG